MKLEENTGFKIADLVRNLPGPIDLTLPDAREKVEAVFGKMTDEEYDRKVLNGHENIDKLIRDLRDQNLNEK